MIRHAASSRDSGDRRADGARARVPRVVGNRSITQLAIPMPHSSNLDRRDFVGACLATVGAGLSLPANAGAQTAATDASVYTRLGLRPIVNAAGILTNLGGSLMPPEVSRRWRRRAAITFRVADARSRHLRDALHARVRSGIGRWPEADRGFPNIRMMGEREFGPTLCLSVGIRCS